MHDIYLEPVWAEHKGSLSGAPDYAMVSMETLEYKYKDNCGRWNQYMINATIVSN